MCRQDFWMIIGIFSVMPLKQKVYVITRLHSVVFNRNLESWTLLFQFSFISISYTSQRISCISSRQIESEPRDQLSLHFWTMTDKITAKIQLFIVIPHGCIRTLSLCRSSTIESIAETLHGTNVWFVYNGELLNPKCTLEFYGIKTNDALVAVRSNEHNDMNHHWMRMTRDSETFLNSLRFCANQESRDNARRLHDLRTMRLETRPKAYRRHISKWAQIDAPHISAVPTILGEPAVEVACDPLPQCWWIFLCVEDIMASSTFWKKGYWHCVSNF
jgi:hypothetical protein